MVDGRNLVDVWLHADWHDKQRLILPNSTREASRHMGWILGQGHAVARVCESITQA